MADRPNIDYAHYAAMLDLVEKITKVSPRSTNLIGVAMEEVKELDEECKAYHDEVAKELAAEKAEKHAEEQARIAAENEENDAAAAATRERGANETAVRAKVEADRQAAIDEKIARSRRPKAIPAGQLPSAEVVDENDDIVATAPPIADPEPPVTRRV